MSRFHPYHEELLQQWKSKLSVSVKLFSNPTLDEVFKDDPYIENWLQGLQDKKEPIIKNEESIIAQPIFISSHYIISKKKRRKRNSDQYQDISDHVKPNGNLSTHEDLNIPDGLTLEGESEQTHMPSVQPESLKVVQNVRLKFEMCAQTGNPEKITEALSEFNSLMKLPHIQLHGVFEDLCLAQLGEEVLTILCNDVVKHQDIAYQNYVVFFRYAFLEKVRQLTSKPSRNFLSTIINTAKAKSKSIVYGL
ncbi:1830_t:CDS:2, partial [Acaulospora morrowiae]